MKTLIKVCIIIGFLFTGTDANAQLWKRVKQKVKNKVEKKVEEKVEKKTDQVLDSLLDAPKDKKRTKKSSKKESSKKNSMGNLDANSMMDMLNSSKNATYDSEYTFPITATMVVTSGNSKPQHMTQSYGEKAILSKVKNTPGIILTDFVNETLIMLNVEEKSAQVMSMKMMNMFGMGSDEAESSETTQQKAVKTGKTKTMNGYLCHEYMITAEDAKINAWFAPEVNFNYQDYLSGFSKMFGGNTSANPMTLLSNGNGYVMEMTAIDVKGESSTMKVTNISEVTIKINMSSYKVQKL
ncbi:hypothetical protein IMCC3317_10130 [Kordia antarctica]|uniref:DUF4412 domain-containing protein n=1 Tax=Kordia antarctica TaxID=1218801 RepID=A0A7L4ZGT7_9FLAO|nr:DUF4412 domain-containing protein [Kordia antarctica]QHI35667.1 hypothetical protein IMCC3317_10130 [Kordia antarctica]